jgi:hypothetical protein
MGGRRTIRVDAEIGSCGGRGRTSRSLEAVQRFPSVNLSMPEPIGSDRGLLSSHA